MVQANAAFVEGLTRIVRLLYKSDAQSDALERHAAAGSRLALVQLKFRAGTTRRRACWVSGWRTWRAYRSGVRPIRTGRCSPKPPCHSPQGEEGRRRATPIDRSRDRRTTAHYGLIDRTRRLCRRRRLRSVVRSACAVNRRSYATCSRPHAQRGGRVPRCRRRRGCVRSR